MPFEGYNVEEHGLPDMQNLDLSKVCRRIVSDKPRVTRFAIQWAGGESKTSGSEVEDMKGDVQMEGDDENENSDNPMMENNNGLQTMFSSPTRNEMKSIQNIVSPDSSCLQDVAMNM